MSKFIRRAGGKKGMEALQAVILLGAGFLVVLGLRGIWSENEGTIKDKVEECISGN